MKMLICAAIAQQTVQVQQWSCVSLPKTKESFHRAAADFGNDAYGRAESLAESLADVPVVFAPRSTRAALPADPGQPGCRMSGPADRSSSRCDAARTRDPKGRMRMPQFGHIIAQWPPVPLPDRVLSVDMCDDMRAGLGSDRAIRRGDHIPVMPLCNTVCHVVFRSFRHARPGGFTRFRSGPRAGFPTGPRLG